MTRLAVLPLAVFVFALAGCPESKPKKEAPAAASAAPAQAAPAAAQEAPKKAADEDEEGGW